jgi:hypothetical protein
MRRRPEDEHQPENENGFDLWGGPGMKDPSSERSEIEVVISGLFPQLNPRRAATHHPLHDLHAGLQLQLHCA